MQKKGLLKTIKNKPQKILEATVKNCSETLTKLLNNTSVTPSFPNELKNNRC